MMKGKTKHPLYQTWANMIARCETPGASRYLHYGGRGIVVCDTWRNDFWSFVDSMGPKPTPRHSLDRIDVNGNYSLENCRWATSKQQARNRQDARYIEIDGQLIHVAEVQEQTGISMKTLYQRSQKGWPLEKILNPEPQYNNSESQAKATKAHADMKRAQTHCKHGHLLSGDNLYLYKGRRHCRQCRRDTDRRLYYRNQK